nr:probable aminotransferase TAT3 [Ziziphus jujuba var. spinosa]
MERDQRCNWVLAETVISKYLSQDLPYQLSPDDVYRTAGCTQAIEAVVSALARPGANILLPKPGYPQYVARAAFDYLQVRHFDPEGDWEVDLSSGEALADDNTAAIVIINPSNPCGYVFKVPAFEEVVGSNPFVPMEQFASILSVLTLGSSSERWIVPGWRLGWIVTNDPNGILKKLGFLEALSVREGKGPDVIKHKVSNAVPLRALQDAIRINTDTATKLGRSMVEIVARNFAGNVVRMWAIPTQSDIPEFAEAFGILQGFTKAKEEGWSKIWLESDAKKLILSLNTNDLVDIHWTVEDVLQEITLLKHWFQEVTFNWVPRQSNFLAHFICNWCFWNNTSGLLSCADLPHAFESLVSQKRGS